MRSRSGLSTIGGDCNDSEPTISPVANELCNDVDDDCDGDIDEDVQVIFTMIKTRLFGDVETSQYACNAPVGYVTNAEDCNDIDNSVFIRCR